MRKTVELIIKQMLANENTLRETEYDEQDSSRILLECVQSILALATCLSSDEQGEHDGYV